MNDNKPRFTHTDFNVVYAFNDEERFADHWGSGLPLQQQDQNQMDPFFPLQKSN